MAKHMAFGDLTWIYRHKNFTELIKYNCNTQFHSHQGG